MPPLTKSKGLDRFRVTRYDISLEVPTRFDANDSDLHTRDVTIMQPSHCLECKEILDAINDPTQTSAMID